jgi:hypothetical protein
MQLVRQAPRPRMEPAQHSVWGLQRAAARCCSDRRGRHTARAPPSAPCRRRAPARLAAPRAAGRARAGRAGPRGGAAGRAGGGRQGSPHADGAARRAAPRGAFGMGRLTRLRRAARCSRRCCWRGCRTSGTPGSRACPSTRSCTRPPCGAGHSSPMRLADFGGTVMHARACTRRGSSARGPCTSQLLRAVHISPQTCTSSAAYTPLFCLHVNVHVCAVARIPAPTSAHAVALDGDERLGLGLGSVD